MLFIRLKTIDHDQYLSNLVELLSFIHFLKTLSQTLNSLNKIKKMKKVQFCVPRDFKFYPYIPPTHQFVV